MLPNVNQFPGPRRNNGFNPFAAAMGILGASGRNKRNVQAQLELYDAQRGIDARYYRENVTHKTEEGLRSHREKANHNIDVFDQMESRNQAAGRRLRGVTLGNDGQIGMDYQSEFVNKPKSTKNAKKNRKKKQDGDTTTPAGGQVVEEKLPAITKKSDGTYSSHPDKDPEPDFKVDDSPAPTPTPKPRKPRKSSATKAVDAWSVAADAAETQVPKKGGK